MSRRYKPIHAAIAVNLSQALLKQLCIFSIVFAANFRRKQLSTFRGRDRDGSRSSSSDDGAYIESVGILWRWFDLAIVIEK